MRHRIDLFFVNLRFPARFVSLLIQLKLVQSAQETGRFITNTTVGIAGFFDPATGWGMPLHQEDFGQALGYWGTPAGPFLMLPFFGPSNPRDAVGLGVDTVLGYGTFVPTNVAVPLAAVSYVDARSLVIEDVPNGARQEHPNQDCLRCDLTPTACYRPIVIQAERERPERQP